MSPYALINGVSQDSVVQVLKSMVVKDIGIRVDHHPLVEVALTLDPSLD